MFVRPTDVLMLSRNLEASMQSIRCQQAGLPTVSIDLVYHTWDFGLGILQSVFLYTLPIFPYSTASHPFVEVEMMLCVVVHGSCEDESTHTIHPEQLPLDEVDPTLHLG